MKFMFYMLACKSPKLLCEKSGILKSRNLILIRQSVKAEKLLYEKVGISKPGNSNLICWSVKAEK